MTALPAQDVSEVIDKSGPWSDQDVQKLITMWATDASASKMSQVLGRTSGAISVKASRLSLPPRNIARTFVKNDSRRVKSGGKFRHCLSCQTQFFSEGAGHRICDKCKSSAAWGSAGSYSYATG